MYIHRKMATWMKINAKETKSLKFSEAYALLGSSSFDFIRIACLLAFKTCSLYNFTLLLNKKKITSEILVCLTKD